MLAPARKMGHRRAMSIVTLIIELAEKMALLASAALVAVLFPPLRKRILGSDKMTDKAAGLVLGFGLALWGAMLGLDVMGEHVNVRAIGVIIAGILGGKKAGLVAGLGSGMFYAEVFDDQAAPWVMTASAVDGLLAGGIASRWPSLFQGGRAFVTSVGIQGVHLVIVGVSLLALGEAHNYLPAWPAHLIKVVVNAAGVTLFVLVSRLVVAREEAAVALVRVKAEADAAALENLRRRLEPHFLFNALNTIRASIRVDPSRARALVSDLADLYRYLLSHPDDATVKEEVDHALAYLDIEKARLGDEKLSVSHELDPSVGGLTMPALLLQPLVENAVTHGVAAHAGPGAVHISARRDETHLVLEVRDEYSGEHRGTTHQGHGIALKTLRERLFRLYGDHGEVVLSSSASGTCAWVRIRLTSLEGTDPSEGRARS